MAPADPIAATENRIALCLLIFLVLLLAIGTWLFLRRRCASWPHHPAPGGSSQPAPDPPARGTPQPPDRTSGTQPEGQPS